MTSRLARRKHRGQASEHRRPSWRRGHDGGEREVQPDAPAATEEIEVRAEPSGQIDIYIDKAKKNISIAPASLCIVFKGNKVTMDANGIQVESDKEILVKCPSSSNSKPVAGVVASKAQAQKLPSRAISK